MLLQMVPIMNNTHYTYRPLKAYEVSQLFAEYTVPWHSRSLGVHLGHLIDVLLVCTGSTSGGEAVLRFPGPSLQLLLE
jgi:hypothetical protein